MQGSTPCAAQWAIQAHAEILAAGAGNRNYVVQSGANGCLRQGVGPSVLPPTLPRQSVNPAASARPARMGSGAFEPLQNLRVGTAPATPESMVITRVDDQPVGTAKLLQPGSHCDRVLDADAIIGFAVQQQHRHAGG